MWWFGPCAGWSCLADVVPPSDWVELRALSSSSPAPVPGLYAARHRLTGDLAALKVLDRRLLRQRATRRRLRQEVKVLQLACGHPNLLQLHDVKTSGSRVELVFELATGGQVLPMLRSEQDASRAASQVVSGLQFLHERGVVHGEVRPEHVLRSEDSEDARVLLVAFGRAAPWRKLSLRCRPKANGFLWDNLHHVRFQPPFVLWRKQDAVTNWREAQQIDVWALGVTLYVMLCGCFPFDGDAGGVDTAVDVERRVLNDRLAFPEHGALLSRAARDLLRRLLEKNADAAMSIEEVAAHPWINGGVAPPASWSADMLEQRRAFTAKYADEVDAASRRRPSSTSSLPNAREEQTAVRNGLQGSAEPELKRDTLEEEAEEEEARPSIVSTHGAQLLLDEEAQERPSAECFMRLASLEMGGNNANDDEDVVADPGRGDTSGEARRSGARDAGRTAITREKSLDKMWQVLLRQRRFFSSKSLSSGSSNDRS